MWFCVIRTKVERKIASTEASVARKHERRVEAGDSRQCRKICHCPNAIYEGVEINECHAADELRDRSRKARMETSGLGFLPPPLHKDLYIPLKDRVQPVAGLITGFCRVIL
jgi:hypothetical protein